MSRDNPSNRSLALREYAERYCDGVLPVEQIAELETRLRDDPLAMDSFVLYMEIHSRIAWNARARGVEEREIGDLEIGRFEDLPQDVGEAVELPRRVEDGTPPSSFILHPSPLSTAFVGGPVFSYMVATVILGLMLLGAWTYTITHGQHGNYVHNNSRGLTAPGRSTQQPPELVFVGRVTGMVDCRWADPTTATHAGSSVPLGRRYALSSGLMEIAYDGGAKVILEGPCVYEVESSGGGFLSLGKLTARVESAKPQAAKTQDPRPKTQDQNPKSPSSLIPHPSSLFTVRTPTAVVTDLGTEFGVEVGENGDTTSHVFQGRVELQTVAGKRPAVASAGVADGQTVQLAAGESARVEKTTGRIAKLDRTSVQRHGFYRQIPKRARIEAFNTGVGLNEGDEDTHWQIAAVSNDPNFKPRPAVVAIANRPSQFRPNEPARSQWISTVPDLSDVPNGATYTFRTTFELTDLVPGSAKMRIGFLADNRVKAVRLNGREIPVPEHGHLGPFFDPVRFVVDKGFIEGSNAMEIDVFNGAPESGPSAASPMALLVELEGTMLRGGRGAVGKTSDEGRRGNDGKEGKR